MEHRGNIRAIFNEIKKRQATSKTDNPSASENYNALEKSKSLLVNDLKQAIKKYESANICDNYNVEQGNAEKKNALANPGHVAKETCLYNCSECDAQCTSLAELDLHIVLAHEQHKCNLCQSVFDSEANLALHISQYHQEAAKERESLQCEICEKTLTSRGNIIHNMPLIIARC